MKNIAESFVTSKVLQEILNQQDNQRKDVNDTDPSATLKKTPIRVIEFKGV